MIATLLFSDRICMAAICLFVQATVVAAGALSIAYFARQRAAFQCTILSTGLLTVAGLLVLAPVSSLGNFGWWQWEDAGRESVVSVTAGLSWNLGAASPDVTEPNVFPMRSDSFESDSNESVENSHEGDSRAITPATVVVNKDGRGSPTSEMFWLASKCVVSTWLIGSLACLLIFGTRWLRTSWLLRSAVPLNDPCWLAAYREAQHRLGLAVPPASTCLHVIGGIESPVASGLGRRRILIPESVVRMGFSTIEMPAEQRIQILLHELAHVARRDCWIVNGTEEVEAQFVAQPGKHQDLGTFVVDGNG